MYEVLDQLNMKDTGSISQVELQNRTNKAIFVRAGTIFKGETQNRASQHSGVYTSKKENIDVRCVHQSHGIHDGAKMEFGDIAPMGVTSNLMKGDQFSVWQSVRRYTGHDRDIDFTPIRSYGFMGSDNTYHTSYRSSPHRGGQSMSSFRLNRRIGEIPIRASHTEMNHNSAPDDLLGHMKELKKGQSMLDDMMQKVPLFNNQVGAIIFNPIGVVAVETFDHPKSWESIKKEIIEKYGDKIMDKQVEHLFELKPEAILPSFHKFIKGMDKYTEKTIRKDEYSETRSIEGDGIIGEYTTVKGQTVHVLMIRDNC